MGKKGFKYLPALIMTVCGSTIHAEELKLKLYEPSDTVFAESYIVVAATEAGSKVTVNGEEVKVYPTGSFAKRVSLKPGDNPIEIISVKGLQKAQLSTNIYRKEKRNVSPKGSNNSMTKDYEEPLFVMTKDGAYLQYGNGSDRLGGSKMGVLTEGITLKIDGEKDDLYRVALAENRSAYIPKSYTEPAETINETVNTGSWSITNLGDKDRVTVSLPTRLAYQYTTDLTPSSIAIDLFGATDNSNWITQRTLDLGMIDYVTFKQVEKDVYRVIIFLKEENQWGFSVDYEGSNLVVDVRHKPESKGLKGLVVGLDAGHGGEYPGAYSPSGLKEKDVNLDIVLKLRDFLEKAGAKVVLTRDGDQGPSMTERKRIWKENGVQIAISIHNNWTSNPLSSPGTAALYKHLFDRPLAEAIARRMLELNVPLFGLVGNFNFSLNGPTDYPNMLVEGLFMNSLDEEALLANPEFRKKMARQIFLGLKDYVSSCGL